MKRLLLLLTLCTGLFAHSTDFHVNNVAGLDEADGLTAKTAFRTIGKAIKTAGPGDTIHLTATGELYRETADFYGHPGGKEGQPLTLDGHGATLSGAEICPPEGWTAWRDNVLQHADLVSNVFMLIDGEMVFFTHSFNVLEPGEVCYMPYFFKRFYFYIPKGKKAADFTVEVGQPDGTSVTLDPTKWGRSHSEIGGVMRYQGLAQPTWVKINGETVPLVTAKDRLKPGEWTSEEKIMYYRPPTGKTPADQQIEAIIRGNGVAMNGNTAYVIIRNLNAQHVYNDGYNIHGHVTHAEFYNCNARQCGDEGFSAHDTCETILDGAIYDQCDNGIANVNTAGGSVTRNVILSNARHVGYLILGGAPHTLENAILVDNPSQLSGSNMKVTNALILRSPDGPRTNALGVGPDTTLERVTVLGNTSLMRADSGATLINCIFGPGQGEIHLRTAEPKGLLKVTRVLIAPDISVSWGAKYPWTRELLGAWLADPEVEVVEMPFAETLIQGKMAATMPADRGCTQDLIQRWLDHLSKGQ